MNEKYDLSNKWIITSNRQIPAAGEQIMMLNKYLMVSNESIVRLSGLMIISNSSIMTTSTPNVTISDRTRMITANLRMIVGNFVPTKGIIETMSKIMIQKRAIFIDCTALPKLLCSLISANFK